MSTNNEKHEKHKVLGKMFDLPTESRLQAMEPANAIGSTLATLEAMSVPRILKVKNPPVLLSTPDNDPILDENGKQIEIDTGLYSLIRDAGWEKDNRTKFYETVSQFYEQVGSYEVAEMLDGLPNFKPDSVTFRNGGETMLVSMKLEETQIDKTQFLTNDVLEKRAKWNYDSSQDGDDGGVAINFFLINPMGGSGTIKGGLKATVKVCANGLTIPMGIQTFSISHTAGAGEHLEEWLNHLWKDATGQVSAYAQALQHLTTIPVSLPDIQWIATDLYPQEKMYTKNEWESIPRRQNWERYSSQMFARNEKNEQKVGTIMSLFGGLGRGINIDTEKTGWDAMMAVSEFENYKRSRREYDTNPIKIYEGERIENMHRAYEMVLQVPERELVPIEMNLPS